MGALVTIFVSSLLIYLSVKRDLPNLWKFLTQTHWTQIRKEDWLKVAGVLGVIVLIEVLVPSAEVFGRKANTFYEPPLFAGNQPLWPETTPVYGEFAKLAPWLSEFSREAHERREQLHQPAKVEKEEEERIKRETFAEYSSAKQKRNAYQRQYTPETSPTYEQTLAVLDEEVKLTLERADAAFSESDGALSRLREIEKNLILLQPDQVVPIFDGPVLMVADTRKVRFKEERSTLPSQTENVIRPFIEEGVRADETLVGLLPRISKRSYLALNGSYKPRPKGEQTVACYIDLQKSGVNEYSVERYCDMSAPIPIRYDLTNSNCDSEATKIEETYGSQFCLERWNVPSLQIRFYQDRLIVYEPIPHNFDFSGMAKTRSSRWEIEIDGQRTPIEGETAITLPSRTLTLSTIKLWHMPRTESTRIWENVDIDLHWFGSTKAQVEGNQYKEIHSFTERSYSLGFLKPSAISIQFVQPLSEEAPVGKPNGILFQYGKAKAAAEEEHRSRLFAMDSLRLDRQLEAFASSIKNLGSLNTPSCVASDRRFRIGNKLLRDILKKYPALRELMKEDGKTVDCKKLNFIAALIHSLKQNTSYTDPNNGNASSSAS